MSSRPSGPSLRLRARCGRYLLWLLAAASAAALLTVAVVAWRAANRQRRDGAGALRQTAAEVAALRAENLEAAFNAARNPSKSQWLVHKWVKRAWFTQNGDPDDWIFGPWPQPENDASAVFSQATVLAQSGRKNEALKLIQPLLGDTPELHSLTTTSGLPLLPLVLRLAMTVDVPNARGHATRLREAALDYPSPLSTPLLEEAAATLAANGENLPRVPGRHTFQERVRAALREQRNEVVRGAAWITTAGGDRWHLQLGPVENGTVSALPFSTVQDVAARNGIGAGGIPALPSAWTLRSRLNGVSLTDADDPSLTAMASYTRGPLVVEVVAHPQTAFAALDSQLLRQRWLIGGASAFIAAAAAAFLLVLARQRRLNAMMANFVAAVSHELRAPIGSMGLLAERLSDGRAGHNGDQAHYHRLIRDECRRLSATIGNVLTFSRRQRGLTAFESELSDLTALLNDAVDLMRPQADERSLILSTDFPDKPVERELDPVIIRQAVLNLLDNAIKFSPPGSTVRLRLRESPDGFAVITVRDEGPGIPPAERTRIFKPFYRTGSELRRETPGIGIGLAIVHAAATAHNGTATASAAPGRGAEFTLRLAPLPSC